MSHDIFSYCAVDDLPGDRCAVAFGVLCAIRENPDQPFFSAEQEPVWQAISDLVTLGHITAEQVGPKIFRLRLNRGAR